MVSHLKKKKKKKKTTPLSRPYFEPDGLSLHGTWGFSSWASPENGVQEAAFCGYRASSVHLCAGVLSHVRLFVTLMDCSPPGSTVHGISQTRQLEWGAISSSRGSLPPRDGTRVSCVSSIAGGFVAACTKGEVCTHTFEVPRRLDLG